LLFALLQIFYPMSLGHLLATMAELGSTYLIFCVVANFTSIFSPVPLASGSLRPAHPKASVVLVQLGFMLLLPILIGVAVLPLGIEMICHFLGWLGGVPIYVICALPELGVVAWLYSLAIRSQGRMLHAREQRILEVVTTKVE
jgi:hypothetical protein